MSFFSRVLLLSVFFIATAIAANGESHLLLESFPKVAKQGDVCLIRASGAASLVSIHGEFQGERFSIFLNRETGTHEGLIGIDLSTSPAAYEIKAYATGGDNRVYSSTLQLRVEKADFGTQALSLPPSMVDLDAKTLERVHRETRKLEALFEFSRNERLWKGVFIRPVEGEISTEFGLNRIINGQRRSQHTGVDLRAEKGTPVLACNHGVVALVDELFFSGKSVVLDHGWGLYSMYFHLSEACVKEGDRVRTGAMLGRVGSTGRSTGSHLHWGMRINGARVDPLSFLKLGTP